MPAILCKCWERISYWKIPNPDELLVISDVEYDSFSGKIDSEELYKQMKSMIKCQKCNRLIYFENGFNKPPIIYKLEF